MASTQMIILHSLVILSHIIPNLAALQAPLSFYIDPQALGPFEFQFSLLQSQPNLESSSQPLANQKSAGFYESKVKQSQGRQSDNAAKL
jgi:hypothetical protein